MLSNESQSGLISLSRLRVSAAQRSGKIDLRSFLHSSGLGDTRAA